MSLVTKKIRLLRMPLKREEDVVLCRNRAKAIAAGLGFDNITQVRIATAVSEIARNAFRYAHDATVEFIVQTESTPYNLLVIVTDKGPGISDLEAILAGTFQSRTGMGQGIRGTKQLMDNVEIETGSDGTTVQITQRLPQGTAIAISEIQRIIDEVANAVALPDPLEELAVQNQELLRTMEEINVQKSLLERVNEELSETNRGVVALYDELDTVYRVGRVVATKLDLESLLKAITDATTDVSGSELGAFFQIEENSEQLVCKTLTGLLADQLHLGDKWPISTLIQDPRQEIYRLDDIPPDESPLGSLPIRSFLSITVNDSAGVLAGALIFGHREPFIFTERTERILSSVAVQVSIGIENARLYHNVQAASAAKDQFLAVLSHELRTPLNPVFGILTSLEKHPALPADVRDDLHVMRRNLQLEARLIDDLLDLTRIVKGKAPFLREVTDIHALVHAVQQTCQTEISKKSVRLELNLEAGQHHVLGDAARLQQVLWNLLNNAVKFTPTNGKIFIRTDNLPNGDFRLKLEDTGRGIASDSLQKIFHPFEQGNHAITTQFGGLGLGLAISRSIIDAHGGEITAESSGLEQGSTFTIKLSTCEPPSPKVVPASPVREFAEGQAISILLVDDHADTRAIMSRLLSLHGHQVKNAGTCAEALELSRNHHFDLLISDLGLPDGSGHDLMATIQTEQSLKGIALSGYGMESDIERSRIAGFLAHLTKPVEFSALQKTIQEVLSF